MNCFSINHTFFQGIDDFLNAFKMIFAVLKWQIFLIFLNSFARLHYNSKNLHCHFNFLKQLIFLEIKILYCYLATRQITKLY